MEAHTKKDKALNCNLPNIVFGTILLVVTIVGCEKKTAPPPPPPSPRAPTATLFASPTSIQTGQSSTLTWNTENASDVTLDGYKVDPSGSQSVSPTHTTTFYLAAKGAGGTQEATAQISVMAPPLPMPTAAPPPPTDYPASRESEQLLPRATGRSFLVSTAKEQPGYGLYSYLLFARPPTAATRDRYIAMITAYLNIPEIEEVNRATSEKLSTPEAIRKYGSAPEPHENITYLPIKRFPRNKDGMDPNWIIENYDYARSRSILSLLRGKHLTGPYIVSSQYALTTAASMQGRWIEQNLSNVPPHLMELWTEAFLQRVSKERYWESERMSSFVVELRTVIAQVSEAKGMREALASWIKLF